MKFLEQMRRSRDDVARDEARHSQAATKAQREAERLRPLYHDACGERGRPMPEADDLHSQLVEAESRAAREGDAARAAATRRAELDKHLAAPDRAKEARARQRQASNHAAGIEQEITGTQRAVATMRDALATEQAAAAAARQRLAGEVLAGLPAEVQAYIAAPVAPDGPATTNPEHHDGRAAALGDAIAGAQAKLADLEQSLTDARQAERDARTDLLEQRALIAAVEHAEALAAYLPALLKMRATHELGYGGQPALPDLAGLTNAELNDAIEDAERAADADSDGGGIVRGLRKLADRLL